MKFYNYKDLENEYFTFVIQPRGYGKRKFEERKKSRMKPETRYRCEKCETLYLEQKDAEKCEKSHLEPMLYTDIRYSRDSIFPSEFTVVFANNRALRYKRIL